MTKAGHEEREKWRHSREGKMYLNVSEWSHEHQTHEDHIHSVLVKVLNAFEAGYKAGDTNGRRESIERIQRCVTESGIR